MATTKKSSTVKKKLIVKGKVRARPLTWKFYVVTIGIFLVAVTSVLVLSFYVSQNILAQQWGDRYDRIQTIYKSLDLDESYAVSTADVFGQKRVYDWDKSRTHSSYVHYIHSDTVSNTVAELDGKIKAAGFTFINEPYPDSSEKQYHYKSDKGEYIRLSVNSKPRDDALHDAFVMNQNAIPENILSMDTNAGPSNVIIKVNLDDNNE